MTHDAIYERYHRQMILPGFGAEKQQLLLKAKVLVVGAGGLGCPVLMSLAGAGVGIIGIADNGLIELSNLHRQFLYTTSDIGQPKTACAKTALLQANPGITIHTYQTTITNRNAIDIINAYDIVIDATDNFEVRYILNDGCALLGKPLVFGAVSRFEGQVTLFNDGITYRDLFAESPQQGQIPNCSEAGVMGFLPGIIGHLMAGECIKQITMQGQLLVGKLLTYSALKNLFWEIDISSSQAGKNALPKNRQEYESRNYAALCNAGSSAVVGRLTNNCSAPCNATTFEISPGQFQTLLKTNSPAIYDIRELHELPALQGIIHQRIPMTQLTAQLPDMKNENVVFICQSGVRSIQAATLYKATYPDSNVYSLRGGIISLMPVIEV